MLQNVKLKDIMTREVISVGPNDMMNKVDQIFRSEHIHHLPVTNLEGRIEGIISKGDYLLLCDHFTLFRTNYEEDLNKKFFETLVVSDVMTKPVTTLHMNDPLSLAVGIFKENLFHAIPIVDDENTVVGIVTTYDLLNYAYKEPLLNIHE